MNMEPFSCPDSLSGIRPTPRISCSDCSPSLTAAIWRHLFGQMPTLIITDLPYTNNLRVAEIVRDGIPARALRIFADTLGLNLTDFARVVLIPRRTLERRIAANAVLRTVESERVVRLGRIFAKAKDVFEDGNEAATWLSEPLDSLGGQTPLQLSSTEPGAREVEQMLGRIEHGVFS